MKFDIYAVKDERKGIYLQPFFIPFYQKSEDVVVDFERNLKAAESVISRNPNDFGLYKIGEFMDETGHFIVDECYPFLICDVANLLKEKQEDVGNTEIN